MGKVAGQLSALVLALCCALLICMCVSGFTTQPVHRARVGCKRGVLTTIHMNMAFAELEQALTALSLSTAKTRLAIDACVRVGWENTAEVLAFAKDFESQPEAMGRILIGDFGLPPLEAHALRSGLMFLLKEKAQEQEQGLQEQGLQEQGLQGLQTLQGVQGLQGLGMGARAGAALVGGAGEGAEHPVVPSVANAGAGVGVGVDAGAGAGAGAGADAGAGAGAGVGVGVDADTGVSMEVRTVKVKSHYKKVVVNSKQKNRRAAGQTTFTYALSTMLGSESASGGSGGSMGSGSMHMGSTGMGSGESGGSMGSMGTLRLRGSPVFEELADFNRFMTSPGASAQELPIRSTTALVYLRHADLFLGWFAALATAPSAPVYFSVPFLAPASASAKAVDSATSVPKLGASSTFAAVAAASAEALQSGSLSLRTVFPTKEKASAAAVYEYIQWLRNVRKISTSYEANVLRGLIKLAKFRFSQESLSDPGYGEKSFEDIPLVRELRKLHSDANRRQVCGMVLYGVCHMSYVICYMSYVICHMS
jgi:hypothetical protein